MMYDFFQQLNWLRKNIRRRRRLSAHDDSATLFTNYYERNEWGSTESRSGLGSEARYTDAIRLALPALFKQYGVRSLVDAPCGDFNWFRLMDLPELQEYVGGEIVPALVEDNSKKYSSPQRRFELLDIRRDPLPAADLWLCRDCLFHFSYRDIGHALENFFQSNIRWLLTTTHYSAPFNFDIVTGGFRPLNFQKRPFNFPKPAEVIEDWIEGFPHRHLALWDRDSLLQRRKTLTSKLDLHPPNWSR